MKKIYLKPITENIVIRGVHSLCGTSPVGGSSTQPPGQGPPSGPPSGAPRKLF